MTRHRPLAAERFVARVPGYPCSSWPETTEVLSTVHSPTRKQIALSECHPATKVGFSDCFVLALVRAEGHLLLCTFDRKLTNLNRPFRSRNPRN